MPEYKTPGVYVQETPRGPPPIVGVPTSDTAFLGETERGPLAPRLVTSLAEYQRWFGAAGGGRSTPDAAWLFFENGGTRLHVARISTAPAAVASHAFGGVNVEAIGPGAWGDRVFVALTAAGRAGLVRLQVAYWAAGAGGFDPFAEPGRWPRPDLIEVFDDLSLDPASATPAARVVEAQSSLVRLRVSDAAPTPGAATLRGGLDGANAPGAGDYAAALAALTDDDIALIHAPGVVDPAIVNALVSHCEAARFRFAILDAPSGLTGPALTALDPRVQVRDTSFAAYYAPWIEIAERDGLRMAPPGGAVAGIYARMDTERGVFKAPANETVHGATGLQIEPNNAAQDVLNPRGVNLIRRFVGRGLRVWGARTLSSDPDYKYINTRRSLIFLEHSIARGLGWAAFEPNDEVLWAKVRDAVTLFLRGQWKVGALFGTTAREAFFVRCDRTTMTAQDIQDGRLVCEIGLALAKPGEFVILRVGLRALGSA